jgi:hypothetical protein
LGFYIYIWNTILENGGCRIMANYTEKCELPSRGVLGKSGAEVVIRNMTTAEEKMLLGSTADALDNILKTCVVSPKDLDLSELISPDKHFLIMKLRIISYGRDYHVQVKCASCGQFSEYKIDLDSLNIDYLPEDFLEPYDEFELPECRKTVSLKIPRIKELNDSDIKAKRYQKKFPEAKGDMGYIYRLMTNIMYIDSKEISPVELQKFIEELHSKDSSYLKNKINKLKVGYDTDMFEDCPKCQSEVRFDLPITAEFFRTRFDD